MAINPAITIDFDRTSVKALALGGLTQWHAGLLKWRTDIAVHHSTWQRRRSLQCLTYNAGLQTARRGALPRPAVREHDRTEQNVPARKSG
jgi:hypothetical protein